MAEVCYGEDLSLLPSAGKLSEYEKRGIRVVTRDTLENTIPFMSLRNLPHLDDGTLLEIDEAMDLYTRRFDLGLARLAELIGLMHDMGKATRRFEAYLSGKLAVSPHHHAPAGAIYAYRRWFLRSGADACARATAQMIMLCIFGHHAGLSDCLDQNGWSPLLNGLETEAASVYVNEAIAWFLENVADADRLDALFEDACREFTALFPDLPKRGSRMDAALGLVCRLLLSILVDNDRWDAVCFEYGENPFALSDHTPDWDALLNTFENYRKTHLNCTEGVDRIRGEISDTCFEKALSSPGVYSLSVPTGGGKTYSSLRYALRHAAHNGHSRIFYIIPYNTILDQNAKDIREALDNYPSILEHHANVVIETESEQAAYKRLTERWDSDIILTSLVQFLNACYAAPNSAARRFHRLTNAVLIFDEIQALPKTCKILFERAIQFLSSYTHSTILLCTATQPRLSLASAPVELVPQVEALHEKLKRVCFIPQLDSARTYASAGERIAQLLEEKSVLAIINTKAAAWQVYLEAVQTLRRRGHAFVRFEKNLPLSDLREAARACPEDEILCVYMSMWLCPAHRIKLIAWIQAWLKAGRRVLCVSTALIEAGINVSFPVVIRDLAGLPSLVQAAGRANRNMEYGEGKVFIWDFSEETECLAAINAQKKNRGKEEGASVTREDYARIACRKWLDVRAFGQVFAFKSGKKSEDEGSDAVSIGIRGPVSIQSAFSVKNVNIVSTQITKSANLETGADPDQRGSDTMGMKHRVSYGVYTTFGSINVQPAAKTGFSAEDAEALKEALRTLFRNDAASARPDGSMEVIKLIWWEHNCPTGQYSSARVHRSLHVEQPDDPSLPPIITVDESATPGLKALLLDGE